MKIDGVKIAEEIIKELKGVSKPDKFFAVVLVGEDKESFGFVEEKKKTARKLGVDFRVYNLPADLNNDFARKEVWRIAKQKKCGGVLVQLPLPEHLGKQYILNAIPREKDVDVIGERALGAFCAGRNPVLPPAVGVVEKIIDNLGIEVQNARFAVVGPGFLVGKPVLVWLTGKAKEIIVLDKGSNFELLKSADIVISGTGSPGIIKPEMLKPEVLVIDFGYGRAKNKITGDFEPPKTGKSKNLKYTPTPGGTGPVLIAKLFENFYRLNSL